MTTHLIDDGAALPVRRDGRVLPAAVPSSEWLGHRDLCSLQWSPDCDCPGGPELLAEQEASTPEALDLFAGAQGSSVGYARAGYKVTAVDIEPHDKHPEVHEFITADAMEVLKDREFLNRFALVHTGPPCQGYSKMAAPDNDHPRLIAPVRSLLQAWDGVYVIENIPDARAHLDHPVQLCGQSLGLAVRRHRLFESNAFLYGTPCVHRGTPIGVYGDHPDETTYVRPNGTSRGLRARRLDEGQAAMGINWMDWDDLTEAIPPAYTEWIGTQLIDQLTLTHGGTP